MMHNEFEEDGANYGLGGDDRINSARAQFNFLLDPNEGRTGICSPGSRSPGQEIEQNVEPVIQVENDSTMIASYRVSLQ
jgi:hypothetical protein